MSANSEIWCVIPVHNHSTTLKNVVEGALRHIDDVVVVDDGSTDANIAEILDGLPASLVAHKKNIGKGAALQTGAKFALDRGARHVITIDADGQHDPDDIPKFLKLLQDDVEKIIVGARDFSNADVPAGNRFGRAFSDFWTRFESGRSFSDSQSGFRAYPAKFLAEFKPVFKTYAFEVEILVRGAWVGYEVKNVDVSVTYTPAGKERISHFHKFKDNFKLSLLHSRLVAERAIKAIREIRKR